MSLNLISSLSFLKSKLEKTAADTKSRTVPMPRVSSTKMDVRRLNSTDMFAGMTESDLDTSSSDSDSDSDSSASSRPSSPSGFNTPEINNKEEPTQVSGAESNRLDCKDKIVWLGKIKLQGVELIKYTFQDILKRCLEMLNSDISDTETQPQPDIERGSSASSQVSVDIKCEPGELETDSLSPACEGLLKIASPVKYSSETDTAGEARVTLSPASPPPPSSPGPPVLEPMTTTTTKPPSPAPAQTPAPAVSVPSVPASSGPVQQIILPPVQAGQQQQFILQPQQVSQPQPMVQIVQAGVPLQITTSPIPLLNAQGQLMATVGGVTSQNQLLSNLQNFVMMVQPGLNTVNNNPVIIKQEQPNQFLKPLTVQQPVQPPPLAAINTSTVNNIFQAPQPLKLPNTQQTISAQPNFNLLQTGQSFNIVQPQTVGSTIQNILQPQSNAMNILANNSSQVTTSSTINLLPTTPIQPNSNIINLPSTSTASTTSSPTVQLVQDPNTGLYNLVQPQQQPQLVINNSAISNNPTTSASAISKVGATPLPAVTESPKRSATPLLAKGSPLKVPKLLLPSLSGTKENKPTPDPPPKQFMCGVCNKYFGNQKNLRVHISEIHEGKRGQFPCDVCNKVFPRKRNMERHKNALHLKNSPVCHMCHKAVVNLEMHIKRFHKGSTEIKIKLEESAATA